jgi:hypothetical protein
MPDPPFARTLLFSRDCRETHRMNGPLADYYHWEETDSGIRIYMHEGMADRLQAAAIESGNEVGGILLGRVEQDRGRPVVRIDDFLPVPCSYRGGPFYDLAGEDFVNLEAALLRTALAGCESPGAASVLGYYRSHRRDGMTLSVADLATIDSYFQAPDSVFLLVKAVANAKACTAGFFFWVDGRIESEFSSLEVALGRTSDRDPAGDAPHVPNAPDDSPAGDLDDGLPADLAALFHQAALPEPFSAPRQPGNTPRPWLALLARTATILIATAALVISVITYLSRPPLERAAATMPAASTLGLRVERNPPDLRVAWNRNAREILAARRATLSIRDGRTQRPSINLDQAGLARGSYLYTRAGDEIQLRLEVFGADGGSVSQSVLVPPGGAK